MRILFFGTSAFAVPILERLVDRGHAVVSCVTQPDRPQGRGLKLKPSPVKAAAMARALRIDEPERLREAMPGWRALDPELGVVVAYGRILSADLLSLPPHGMFGVHPSLLPKYRGANPMGAAILAGETATGVTIFRLNARMDAGEIALQRQVAIEPNETTGALSTRLADLGAELLVDAVDRLAAGSLTLSAQDDSQATFSSKISKTDGRIDWTRSAETIHRLVRAATPWPGAWTMWHGEMLKLWDAQPASSTTSAAPGTVINAESDGISVATGQGALVVRELQIAGGRRVSVREFLTGHRMNAGDILGS